MPSRQLTPSTRSRLSCEIATKAPKWLPNSPASSSCMEIWTVWMFSSKSRGLRILFVVSDLHTYTHSLYLFSVGTASIEGMVDFLLTIFFLSFRRLGTCRPRTFRPSHHQRSCQPRALETRILDPHQWNGDSHVAGHGRGPDEWLWQELS